MDQEELDSGKDGETERRTDEGEWRATHQHLES